MSEPQEPGAAKPQWSGPGDSMFSTRSTAAASDTIAALVEREGRTIGRYKLLQLIGEGGFGSVFLAEQSEPVRRRVALKIIKPGMDSKMVAARFEAERQALALMDHPHIARVFDGGVTDAALGSRPYFVMEYVIGDPITNFADAHKLSVRERLDLFTQVCDAVQHAHTKGIIHRDLKPGNILASVVDGRPYARVIDFGIAKATGSSLTDKTLFTEHRQLIGTPEYMSPEQAEGSPDIDTRTDVYALGVLLYELLTGATPFDASRLRSAAFAEMQRIIKEEDPPAPSMKLSRNLPALAAAAAARQADPARLGTLIKGELDWISMKAIDKDRSRRYESPNQLGADVRRHLSGTAVLAAPPSAGYKLRKFVRKNRGAVVAAGLVTAALLVAIAGTTWGLSAQLRALRAEAAKTEGVEWDAYKARILVAQSFVREQNFAETGKRLTECPEKHRGWEWQFLSRYASSGVVRLPPGLGRVVPDAERAYGVSDDGWRTWKYTGETTESPAWMQEPPWVLEIAKSTRRVLAATSRDVRVWEADGTLRGEATMPFQVAVAGWSHSGERAVLVRDDEAQVIDSTARPTGEKITAPERIKWADVADDGRVLLVGNDTGVGRVWAPDGRTILATLGPVGAATFGGAGEVILSEDVGGEVQIFDASPAYSGVLARFSKVSAEFSPDRAVIAIRGPTGVQLRTARGEPIGEPLRHGELAIQHAVFSPDGRRIVTVAAAQMRFWDMRGAPISEPLAIAEAPTALTFSPDSRRVLTIAPTTTPAYPYRKAVGKRLALWDLDGICRWSLDFAEPESAPNNGYGVPLTAVEFSPDGKCLVAMIPEGTASRWFLIQPEVSSLPVRFVADAELEAAAEEAALGSAAPTPRAKPELTLRNNEGSWQVVDSKGATLGTLVGHIGEVQALAVQPGGERIATAGADRTVRIWETARWREAAAFAVPNEIESLEFSPFGSQLVLREKEAPTPIVIWDARSSDERRRDAEVRAAEELAARKLVEDLLAGPRTLDEISEYLRSDMAISKLRRQIANGVFDRRRAEIRSAATQTAEARRERYLTQAQLEKHRERGDVPDRVWREVLLVEASWTPSAKANNTLAWAVVKKDGESKERIDAAVELAREAVRLEPGDWQITNTLALALYRAGNYQEAISAFDRSDREFAGIEKKADPPGTPPTSPSNQIGLAMCEWKLGRQDDARKRLQAAEAILARPPGTALSADDQSLMQEAKELMAAPPPASP